MAYNTRATAQENGNSLYSVDLEVGGYTLQGDEPKEAGGAGGGPAPFDLLTASLAACTAMTIRWYAQKKGMPLRRVRAEVLHHAVPVTDAAGQAVHFSKKVFLEGEMLTDAQKTKLYEIAAKCPIQKVLEASCVVSTVFAGMDDDEAPVGR